MKTAVQIYSEISHEFGLPQYETLGAAGMDVRANVQVLLQPKETKLIPTGIYVAIPSGYEIQVRPRSGVSLKTSLRVANAPGTIDSDYRGEICIIAQNTHSSVEMCIGKGERIAQIVLQKVPQIEWETVNSKEELGQTLRGTGGFGSTGMTGMTVQ